jgi:DNA-binding transcriptional MocR family regulator
MTRYERLAGQVEEQIKKGTLRAGQRLPSIRELSATESLSATTVVEAYALLQDRGWIESRARSGFFVSAGTHIMPPVDGSTGPTVPKESLPMSADDLVFVLRQAVQDPHILPLGAATPMPEYYPHRAVGRCLRKVLADEPTVLAEYQFLPGTGAFRQAVSLRYAHFGVDVTADNVICTSGATEAMALALQCVAQKGDVVAIETPTYFGIVQLVRALGLKIVELPLNAASGLEPEQLDRAIARCGGSLKAAVLVPSHSNPLGTSMSDQNKTDTVSIAAAAGVVLIEDDVYGDLSFERQRPRPLKAFDGNDTTILCGSFSKTVAPGLSCGFVISAKFAKELTVARATWSSGVSVLAEEAMALYLKEGGYDRHLKWVRREYRTLTCQFRAAIADHFPDGTRVSDPQGGYVLWVQLPAGVDAGRVQVEALKQNISVAAGNLFSSQQDYRDCLRINCAVPWGPRVDRGIRTIGRIVKSQM